MGTHRLRAFLFALLTGLVLAGTASPAHAQFGVAAGLNFESVEDIDTSTDASENTTLDNSTGYHVGVVYDLGLGPLSIRPGVFYRRVGQTYDLPTSVSEANANVAAWEVPVDVRLSLFSSSAISPYVLAGPKASFVRSDVQEIDDQLETVSYSVALGAGVEITLGSAFSLQPELRYDYGATKYIDDEIEVGDTTFSQKDPTLSAFSLRLNLVF